MLALDSPRWSELEHAYGPAVDIPDLLRALDDLPRADGESEPWFSLWSALAHQGDVYSASFAAVPHVVRALSTAPDRADGVYLDFPAWIEICRQRRGAEIPFDLKAGYFDALAQLPALVAAAAGREWDSDFLTAALTAIAAVRDRRTSRRPFSSSLPTLPPTSFGDISASSRRSSPTLFCRA